MWELTYDEEPKQQPVPTYEIAEGSLNDISQSQSEVDHGLLYLIDRNELPKHYLKRKYLRPDLHWIYLRIKNAFGVDNIVSFQEIRLLFPEYQPITLAFKMAWLWGMEYLEKYAKGKYGAHRSNWKGINGQTMNTRGKYFGVHYKVTDKKL